MAKPARRGVDGGLAPHTMVSSRRSKWPTSPLVGARMPPDIDWLIAYLAKINRTNRPIEVIVKHAFGIRGRLLDLRVRGRGTYCLQGNIKDGFRVEPKPADRGLANELARLERAARSGSNARWIKAWAAVSPRCRDLVWRPTPPRVIKRKFDKSGRLTGFKRGPLQEEMIGIDGVLIGPRAVGALVAIVEARRSLAATNQDDRRGNKRNEAAVVLAAAMRSAVFELTGRVGFTRDPLEDSCSGPLVELGAAAAARFGIRIGWRLTATK